MINVFPDNFWLANAILIGIGLTTAAVAAVPTLRWDWKAWPLVLGAGLTIPIIIAVVLMAALPLVADRTRVTGFFVHTTTLLLIGISSALLGAGLTMALRRLRSKVR